MRRHGVRRNCGIARYLPLWFALFLFGCAHSGARQKGPNAGPFSLKSLGKTDIDQVLEVNVRQQRGYLKQLMEKLYKRNPRELRRSPFPDASENISRLFQRTKDWRFRDLDGKYGTVAIRESLEPDFRGDRVFAFMVGITSMIMASYNYKTQFYLLDMVDPQKLYNSARNIEIADWKLQHNLDARGKPLLYTNSLPGESSNLSFERLFGKLIGLQDTMAIIIAGKTNRVIRKVLQDMATAVFLPVP